jgi:tetratricopeptide (TPR) repeat protein
MTSHRVSFCLCLVFGLSSAAFAQNLFQKIPPGVQHGMDAYQKERFEEALEAFEEAQLEMPSNAQLEFNRGTTFYKQEKYNEALQSLNRARELDDGKLQGDVFYNMGNTYAAMGKASEAMASYRQALRANPQDTMARHNLEFLLSQPPPPPSAQKDDASPGEEDKPEDADPKSDTSDASSQQQPRDDASPQQPRDDSNPSASPGNETHAQGNQEGTPPTPDDTEDASQIPNDTKPDGDSKQNNSKEEALDRNTQEDAPPGRQERRLRKEDADKILDAFGMDEKSYEPWRFQKKPPAEEGPYAKDW